MDIVCIALAAVFVLAAAGLARACRALETRGSRP